MAACGGSLPGPDLPAAWVPTTGELYAMELSEPDERRRRGRSAARRWALSVTGSVTRVSLVAVAVRCAAGQHASSHIMLAVPPDAQSRLLMLRARRSSAPRMMGGWFFPGPWLASRKGHGAAAVARSLARWDRHPCSGQGNATARPWSPSLEPIPVAEALVGPVRHLDAARDPVGLHAAGHIAVSPIGRS
jgi:hypothetical protein